ncbi:hypothetical protein NBRC111894_2302 [Sporolactobacillus inulinus]|uniref:Uncharacterized protein n=1 Tax=Sporolactobacillus inulinus TaxID=2078 RepID=A0A4Y1ZDS7_9BACL|nr:hypothetical protein NBRC111894_2302 [Sporolactobacillus inulinus]
MAENKTKKEGIFFKIYLPNLELIRFSDSDPWRNFGGDPYQFKCFYPFYLC